MGVNGQAGDHEAQVSLKPMMMHMYTTNYSAVAISTWDECKVTMQNFALFTEGLPIESQGNRGTKH